MVACVTSDRIRHCAGNCFNLHEFEERFHGFTVTNKSTQKNARFMHFFHPCSRRCVHNHDHRSRKHRCDGLCYGVTAGSGGPFGSGRGQGIVGESRRRAVPFLHSQQYPLPVTKGADGVNKEPMASSDAPALNVFFRQSSPAVRVGDGPRCSFVKSKQEVHFGSYRKVVLAGNVW